MNNRTWIAFIAVVVVLFGALLYFGSSKNIDVSAIDGAKPIAATEDSGNIADHVYGNADSKVVLVEYGDYQCPGCGAAAEPIETVTEKYKDKMAFIFRNFPITTIHPNARAAAAAAETAGFMGKYWGMHHLLYANQSTWQSASANDRTDRFATFAAEIGLNREDFLAKLTEKNALINQKIDFDQALAKKAGVSGTPTFYLNGKLVDQFTKDGKIVAKGTEGSEPIWSDADAFETLIILPAFKEAGINTATSK